MRLPIAVVLTSFDPGGTERQMTELIARLDQSRFELHVACFRREGEWLPRVEAATRSITRFPLTSFRSPASWREILRFAGWCRTHRLAVVHACDFYANVFGLTGAALAAVPLRIGARRDILIPQRSSGQHRLQALSYRFAHRVVANSQAAAAQVVREGVSPTAVMVIPNGIDLDRYRPAPARPRRRIITTVANLRAEKGHDVLIRAAALVAQRFPDVAFQFAGDGPRRAALEAEVKARGLEGVVGFLGHREDVPNLLAQSDAFVLPSRTEAFPNGVLEAMAAGLPVIASRVGGIPEVIAHDRNGVLVPPGDDCALAEAVVDLLQDPARADRLARAARETIVGRYSFDRMVRAFERMYCARLSDPACDDATVPRARTAI
ncbi:MAG TPA: glycosyltransferase [Vicinamibacterales bacterium]|nr:glycosyltransferase [Vicinamibacterales bacterium]